LINYPSSLKKADRELMIMLKILSIAALILMIVSMAGLLATDSLISPSPVAIGLQGASVALMVWARITFGKRSFHAAANPTEGGLVTTGPYRFIRHPIYTAVCLFCWVGIAANWSLIGALLGILLLIGGIGRMLCEEQLVVGLYPEYRQYAQVTRRMIPHVF
jgi:protein-S-isoprenylcysteine O-methyltransferase Ste14